MHEQIRDAIKRAAATDQKIAMFHYQVLANASALRSVDPSEFCLAVGVPKSYQTEFRKMLALAHLMIEQGVKLA